MLKLLLLACLCGTTALSQTGVFAHSDDVGDPSLKGAAEFDAAKGQYKITGAGADIWGKADQFHYVWEQLSGDFTVTATAEFLTGGIGHRKASIMLRQSLDTDSPFLHLAIHGDGLPSVQFRSTKADNVNTIDFPVEGPGVYTLKLMRQGGTLTFWIAKDHGALRELGHTANGLGSPVMVGLAVSSHAVQAVNTVLFSDVAVERLPMRGASGSLGVFTNSGDVGGPAIPGVTEFANGVYRITGAGANIWDKRDQFQYVWKEMSGNFEVMATVKFLGEGAEHRKAGIMVRQSLDADAAYADVVMHGSGMPGLQWRSRQGESTNALDAPFSGPLLNGEVTIKMVREGAKMFMFVGGKEIAHTEVTLGGPVLVGLVVCSHDAGKKETVEFREVGVEGR